MDVGVVENFKVGTGRDGTSGSRQLLRVARICPMQCPILFHSLSFVLRSYKSADGWRFRKWGIFREETTRKRRREERDLVLLEVTIVFRYRILRVRPEEESGCLSLLGVRRPEINLLI